MTKQLDTTLKAAQDGLTTLSANQGVKAIDGWLSTLEKADFRGAKVIHENLGKLKTHLEAGDLDAATIAQLLKTLGEETARTASHVDGADGKKITQLAELLGRSAAGLV